MPPGAARQVRPGRWTPAVGLLAWDSWRGSSAAGVPPGRADSPGSAAADEHFLVQPPGPAAIRGDLAGPPERLRGGAGGDVPEGPALGRVVIQPVEDDIVALGPADEPADPAVERVDPGRPPRAQRRVVEPERGAVKWPQPGRRLAGRGHPPHILDGPAVQDPAEMQVAAHGGRLPVPAGAAPFDVPGPDEPAEQGQRPGQIRIR